MPLRRADVHVDAPITNFVVQYGQTAQLAAMVMEVITDNESDTYFRFEQNARRVRGIKRADGTISQKIELAIEQQTFAIDEYALHTVFGARLLKIQHPALKLLDRAAVILEGLVELEYEFQIFTLLTTAGNYATGHTVTLVNRWDDYVNGDPKGDVQAALKQIKRSIGGVLPPGAEIHMALPVGACNKLETQPDVIESVKYTAAPATAVSPELLAQYFKIDEVVVPEAVANAQAETPDVLVDPTGNAYVWPDTTKMACVAVVGTGLGGAAPDTADFTAFASFATFGMAVRRWANNEELANQAGAAQFIEASKFWDLRIPAVDTKASGKSIAAYRINNILL